VSRPAAFFDMDHTLLQCNTASLWLRWLRRHNEISIYRTVRAIGWLMQYKLAVLDMESVTARATLEMAGQSEDELVAKTQAFFAAQVLTAIAPKALDAIQRHREEGHVMAILSSSTPYMVEPLAAHLGIEHAICTRLHVEGGRFAGTHVRPACYGEGKVHWAEAFAEANDIDLARSFFYSDSYSDLPMLQRVGMARVVNPDTRLRRHARRVGWDVDLW
jgi:HAD superfamily hydrolase (TIGR01490 family)